MKIALVVLLLAVPAFAQEQVWTWSDERGEEHYTNDKSSIPDKFRAKAKSTSGDELSILKTSDGRSDAAPEPAKVAPPKTVVIDAKGAPGPIRVVLFEASTNSASRTLNRSGVLDKLVSNNPGLKLERVEFARAVDRAEKLKVSQLPTVLFIDDTDTVLTRASGLVTLRELQQQLDKARGATP